MLNLSFVTWLSFLMPSALDASWQEKFDQCSENKINWSEVHTTIFQYASSGQYDSNFEWVRALAYRGSELGDSEDCWYGWIALRFFLFLIVDSNERAAWLTDESFFSLEWRVWLSAPWVQTVDSKWDILHLFMSLSSTLQKDGIDSYFTSIPIEECSQQQYSLLNFTRTSMDEFDRAVEEDNDISAEWGQAAIDVLLTEGVRFEIPCQVHASIAARLLLGLLPASVFHVTPGYALRATQEMLGRNIGTDFLSLVLSPFPIFSLFRMLKQLMAKKHGRPDANTEDAMTEVVMSASLEEFPSLPSSSFLPPISRRERLQLLETLHMVHTALEGAHIGYVAMTGTILGALRHHGFVPWDGDADVCVDIRDEPRLFLLVLLQNTCNKELVLHGSMRELQTAACIVVDAGFELYAHADRPLTYKMSVQHSPRLAGRPYGYPYVDLWFCHGWAEGQFSMQSAHFGVPIPREYIFPRRKVFFAGLTLWTFADPFSAVTAYYQSGWFDTCVGHETFHRQERKYSQISESDRFNARVPCTELASQFAFASMPAQGLPLELLDENGLLLRLRAWFKLRGSVTWSPTFGGEDALNIDGEWPMSFSLHEGTLRPSHVISVSSSILRGSTNEVLHHLSDIRIAFQQSIICDLVLRFVPLREADVGTQLIGARNFIVGVEPSTVYSPLFESKSGALWRMEVPSCVCRCKLGQLQLEWVNERIEISSTH